MGCDVCVHYWEDVVSERVVARYMAKREDHWFGLFRPDETRLTSSGYCGVIQTPADVLWLCHHNERTTVCLQCPLLVQIQGVRAAYRAGPVGHRCLDWVGEGSPE